MAVSRSTPANLLKLSCMLTATLGFSVPVVAEDSYCLSGGNRTAYSCERNNVVAGIPASERYAVQVVAEMGSRELEGLSFEPLYETPVAENKRLVYLGDFAAVDDGREALKTIGQQLGAGYSPMLVAFTPREPMPLIRLVEEPDQAWLQLAQAAPAAGGGTAEEAAGVAENTEVAEEVDGANTAKPSEATVSAESETSADDSQYDLVYSIQIGAFKYASYGQRFARQHARIPLQCREKANGIFAVYYGLFENYSDAKGHLQDYPLLDELGAYVVKLREVTFSPCDALAVRIKESRQAAYGEDRCGGTQGCDIKAATQQFLPKLPGVE